MTRLTLKASLMAAPALLAAPALAHDAGGMPHIHPHGGEMVVALAVLVAAVALGVALRGRR